MTRGIERWMNAAGAERQRRTERKVLSTGVSGVCICFDLCRAVGIILARRQSRMDIAAFHAEVYRVIRRIPEGKVSSYGKDLDHRRLLKHPYSSRFRSYCKAHWNAATFETRWQWLVCFFRSFYSPES
jgi:hypothetical protein